MCSFLRVLCFQNRLESFSFLLVKRLCLISSYLWFIHVSVVLVILRKMEQPDRCWIRL